MTDLLHRNPTPSRDRPPQDSPVPETITPVQRTFWISYSALILISAAHWVHVPESDALPIAPAHARSDQTVVAAVPARAAHVHPAAYVPDGTAESTTDEPLAAAIATLPWAATPCTIRSDATESTEPVRVASISPVRLSSGNVTQKPGQRARNLAPAASDRRHKPVAYRMPAHPRSSAALWP